MFVSGQRKAYDFVESEMAILKKLDHPNVLRTYEIMDDPQCDKLYIVTEFITQGSLADKLEKRNLTDDELWRYIRDLLKALEYLHRCAGVAHRDIKPDNILLDDTDRVKIADFGLS